MRSLQDLLRENFQDITSDTRDSYILLLRSKAYQEAAILFGSSALAGVWASATARVGEGILVTALLPRILEAMPITRKLYASLKFAGWPTGYLAGCISRWEARVANN
jgi:hypothetical protein